MKINEALPPIDNHNICLEPNRTTSTSTDSKPIKAPTNKLPPGAKVVGNYLLGLTFKT